MVYREFWHFLFVVDKDDADEAVQILRNAGVESYCIGEIIKGYEGIIIE